jgi:hypothetical protein
MAALMSLSGPNVTNILFAPHFVELRLAMVDALAAYPEARARVAQALHKLESKAAERIKPPELPS